MAEKPRRTEKPPRTEKPGKPQPSGRTKKPGQGDDSAHDVLAAEEFGMGTPDPKLHVEPAHDVLAAEEFALGDSDPVLHHHGPVALPSDPTGIAEPHDVLAAEEFALPAGHHRGPAVPGSGVAMGDSSTPAGQRRPLLIAGGLALAALVLRRRRR
jgi:hypothetical protein